MLTKSRMLVELKTRLTLFKVPDLLVYTVEQLSCMSDSELLSEIKAHFSSISLIVRSSAGDEDGALNSNAGAYESVLGVQSDDESALSSAVDTVIDSYRSSECNTSHFEIIFQTLIECPALSGVVFTHDMNTGAPYYVINYDDVTGLTNSVTSGDGEYSNRTLHIHRDSTSSIRSERFKNLIAAVRELECQLESEFLDIEFALDEDFQPYLFQVRSITTYPNWNRGLSHQINAELNGIQSFIRERFKPAHGVYGRTTVFGQMPDWNPAEMIGRAPRALSLSLYRRLITDDAWRIGRQRMGYAVPSGQPLMVSLAGQPFIDTRLSFHSYLPATLPPTICEKLVDFWVSKLREEPQLHDKIEFDIAITTFSFDLNERLVSLAPCLDSSERNVFRDSLVNLTEPLLKGACKGSIESALHRIDHLSNLDLPCTSAGLVGLNYLINNCVSYGTIPFAILARHGFIARTLIFSLLHRGVIDEDTVALIQGGVRTVAGDMIDAINKLQSGHLSLDIFLERYGHLRPGTYDILSKRYDQSESFGGTAKVQNLFSSDFKPFNFSPSQRRYVEVLLSEYSFTDVTADSLQNYIASAISGREYGKFVFTRSLSAMLELIAAYGESHGLSRDEMSHVPLPVIQDIGWVSEGSTSIEERLRNAAKDNASRHSLTSAIRLPQVLFDEAGVRVVPFQVSHPNFITKSKVIADVVNLDLQDSPSNLAGRIILIENADPGYDWVFAHAIAGLVTKYGGVNSHMAIRCAEFGIPAAIGCGEQRFEALLKSSRLSLDCSVGLLNPVH